MFENYACDRCGACCSLRVEPTYADGLREERLVQIMLASVSTWPTSDKSTWRDEWREGNITPQMRDPSTRCCVFARVDDELGVSCEIYATRPQQCVAVEPGDAICQHARDIRNLPPLRDRDGNEPTREMMEASAELHGLDFIPLFDDEELE